MSLSTVGAAFGTSKAGIGIAGLGTFRPDLIMKSLIPVVVSARSYRMYRRITLSELESMLMTRCLVVCRHLIASNPSISRCTECS